MAGSADRRLQKWCSSTLPARLWRLDAASLSAQRCGAAARDLCATHFVGRCMSDECQSLHRASTKQTTHPSALASRKEHVRQHLWLGK